MKRFIAIDPSSTFTGWAVFEGDGLVAWGNIDARTADYAGRFQLIIGDLAAACVRYGAREIAIEDVKFAWAGKNRNRNIAGLQVVFRSIQEWAKEINFPLNAYNPATWKNGVLEGPHASKKATKENICFRFPNLPRKLSEHVYDAIGIGIYHGGTLKIQSMAVAQVEESFARCVKCGRPVEGSKGKKGFSICQDCAGKIADGVSREDRLALAKTGLDALIDEATGFEKVRPPDELRKRLRKHRGTK